MSRRYVVTTPHGIVTRRTERAYAYVVTRPSASLAEQYARAVDTERRYKEMLATAEPTTAAWAERCLPSATTRADALRKRIDAEGAGHCDPITVGWCGRLDLTTKLLAQNPGRSVATAIQPSDLHGGAS